MSMIRIGVIGCGGRGKLAVMLISRVKAPSCRWL